MTSHDPTPPLSLSTGHAVWFLGGRVSMSDTVRHLPVCLFPFLIGRHSTASMVIDRPNVSSLHAKLDEENGQLVLTDLGSTNGTFVNGTRITTAQVLHSEDLIQFADSAFRVLRQDASSTPQTVSEDIRDHALALVQFDRLMSQQCVVPHFQPIVSLVNGTIEGFEVLGRSRLPGLEMPVAMFHAAAQLNLEAELSRMLRWKGTEVSLGFEVLPHLFVNTHPAELEHGLLDSLNRIRKLSPTQKLTLEIHESAVTDSKMMNAFRQELAKLDINLAYDDFGAGQNRLRELIEVPPHYLKFDMSLIRGIHQAPRGQRELLETLVRAVRELKVVPLAEGIECEEEARVCRDVGFMLAQGFYFGKPAVIQCFRSRP